MQILICGAGKSGASIAEKLSLLGNEVTIIDSSQNLVRKLTNKLDIRGVVGHGAHPDILEKAGAKDADMMIAITSSDEVNMLACQIVNSIFEVPKRIARIRDKSYLDPSHQDLFTSDKLPVSVIISPENEVAKNVLRRLEIPGAIENIPFVNGSLKFLGIKIDENCPIIETEISDLTNLFFLTIFFLFNNKVHVLGPIFPSGSRLFDFCNEIRAFFDIFPKIPSIFPS